MDDILVIAALVGGAAALVAHVLGVPTWGQTLIGLTVVFAVGAGHDIFKIHGEIEELRNELRRLGDRPLA